MRRPLSGLLLFGALTVLSGSAAPPSFVPEPTQAACCKTCRKGKTCGDSCIARSKTCNVGPGCACDG